VVLRLVQRMIFPPPPVAPSDACEPEKADNAVEEPKPSRRKFLTYGARLAVGGAAAAGVYSILVETRWFRVSNRVHRLKGLPPELDGLRIVQLTDIHHGPTMSPNYVRQVIEAANDVNADLVLLTGDYVYRSPMYIQPVMNELAKLRGKIGVIGVLGNHDWWQDGPATKRAFREIGVPLVDNDRLFLTPDRKLLTSADRGLCIAGIGDYTEDVVDFERALANVPADMPRLLMSHNPDAAEDTRLSRGGYRVDLMLCGHTHGGQVWIPGIGTPILPSRYGQKYASGLVKGPVCDVFVCRGVGTTVLPMRFCVRPEVAVIEFRCG
jgi:predicted MPP superfamily phosphohydrolase